MNDQHFIESIRATNRAALLALAVCGTAYACFEAIATLPNLAACLAAASLVLTAVGFILACVVLGRSAKVGLGAHPRSGGPRHPDLDGRPFHHAFH